MSPCTVIPRTSTLLSPDTFDIYVDDPQSQVCVTTDGFERLGLAIGALRMPIVIVQEGGYHLESLEANARAFFGGFLSRRGDR